MKKEAKRKEAEGGGRTAPTLASLGLPLLHISKSVSRTTLTLLLAGEASKVIPQQASRAASAGTDSGDL